MEEHGAFVSRELRSLSDMVQDDYRLLSETTFPTHVSF